MRAGSSRSVARRASDPPARALATSSIGASVLAKFLRRAGSKATFHAGGTDPGGGGGGGAWWGGRGWVGKRGAPRRRKGDQDAACRPVLFPRSAPPRVSPP